MTRPLDVAQWVPWLRERASKVPTVDEPLSVTFPAPTRRLVTRVQIALGADLTASPLTWQWADITERVRYDLGIQLTTGRPDESGRVNFGRATLKLDNRDGRFSRRNPLSPYYGLLTQNTPIWITVDAGSGVKTRLEMFVNEWPVRWFDKSAKDSTVTIQCAGALRRLAQGDVLKSALRRSYLSSTEPVPVAYWPLEDSNGAIQAASGLVSGSPLTPMFGGVPTFTTGISGSAGALDMVASDPVLLAATVSLPSASGFQVEFACLGKDLTPPASHIYVEVKSGTVLVFLALAEAMQDGLPHHLAFQFVQNGANVDVHSYRDGLFNATTTLTTQTLATSVRINTNTLLNGTALIAHIAVYGFADMEAPTTRAPAADGYAGEQAHVRIARLCAEEGVPFVCLASSSAAMGSQPIEKFIDLLRDAETADMGVLFETGWGLGYQALSQRYNAPVGMALDFVLGQIAETPEPADDDQRLRNKWTVSRPNGSEYTAEQATGPMGTGPGGPGVFEGSATPNVEKDTQLPDQANWRVHQGTVDEDRWPSLDINLAASPELIDTWTSLPYGARVTAANPPSQVAPDTIDAVIEGYTERWDPFVWTASLNTSPASPYRVGVVASTGNVGRVDMATSTLAADATDVATTLSVASTTALWRTGAVNFDIGISGERMTVTNISGGSSPQTFTVTRSVNGVVKAQPATIAGRAVKVSLWNPAVVAR